MNTGIETSRANLKFEFVDLCIKLWDRIWVIASVAISVFLVGLLYVNLLPEIYEARAHVRPPLMAQLTRINQSNLIDAKPDTVFSLLVNEVRSLSTQRQVFESFLSQNGYDGLDSEQSIEIAFMTEFVPAIRVSLEYVDAEKSRLSAMVTSVRHHRPESAALLANSLIEEAERRVRKNLTENLNKAIASKIEVLKSRSQQKIKLVKNAASDKAAQLQEADEIRRKQLEDRIAASKRKELMRHLDQVARLREALNVARELNLVEPTGIYAPAADKMPAIPDHMNYPLFLRGTKLLKAEIDVLEARKSDGLQSAEIRSLEEQLQLLEQNREVEALLNRTNHEAFAPGMAELREDLAELEVYRVQSHDDVRLLRIDQKAIPPEETTAPKTALILSVAILLGVVLGVLVAAFVAALRDRQRSHGMEI